jgi:hypothetical protein
MENVKKKLKTVFKELLTFWFFFKHEVALLKHIKSKQVAHSKTLKKKVF